ncbi:hypothetical protein [Dactylosporangium sp. NPDC051541]|uniref:hypothetical protein n=1 Tax=Dactylosporangium sp. NPDC051541 TaxID=3363977 RepID=UPI0037A71800
MVHRPLLRRPRLASTRSGANRAKIRPVTCPVRWPVSRAAGGRVEDGWGAVIGRDDLERRRRARLRRLR